jgi:hypothetical protein
MDNTIAIQEVVLGDDGHLAIDTIMTLRVDKGGHVWASLWD